MANEPFWCFINKIVEKVIESHLSMTFLFVTLMIKNDCFVDLYFEEQAAIICYTKDI